MVPLTKQEREDLAEKNLGIVYYLANQFGNYNTIERDDLISAGLVGLSKALGRYDSSNKAKFSTYAYVCVRNEILFFLRKEKKHMSCVSMQKAISEDGEGHLFLLEDILFDKNAPVNDDEIVKSEELEVLGALVTKLTDLERFIIERRYGLNGNPEMTQTQIAELVNLSQASISKIEDVIKKKLARWFKKCY
jgi:RNA polymerase sporulation-specific sigma factor